MPLSTLLLASAASVLSCLALPTTSTKENSLQSAEDAVPGESYLSTTYTGKQTPLGANYTRVIPPTDPTGSPAPDNVFSSSEFTNLGLPNSTYRRIAEIRDNEAGQLRIFRDQISNHSLKPDPANTNSASTDNPQDLPRPTSLHRSLQYGLPHWPLSPSQPHHLKSALMAIGQVETSHNIWSLLDVFNTSPFSGPADTVYPYANQILDTTNVFVVPGSCPKANPVYPNPRQGLPLLAFSKNSTSATEHKRDRVQIVPFERKTNSSTIPERFDPESSIIMVTIADRRDAPTEESVVAGPWIILEQPESMTLEEPTAV
ncbi:hypothetical protein IFM58399_07856 [Aspergillus lentulus]|uniref:Uncharacterized protein n=1 Tax=Aspergillus lentulus TaxID=293939 RepID=A0ABQ1AUV4_ASPLE|nr:uncharacterized protein IFM58399_07856 [Aspergillus lentulus]GFF46680.1 hypothetical protein IFM58399_07856 [Aspergillus lentulus]GFF88478.1 hypothetical protein IFM60648_08403 [Aspergillus lentulus]